MKNLKERYDQTQTVCFTGHRPGRLPKGEDALKMQHRLSDAIEDAIKRGKINFVSGAMSGFDTLAAEQVIKLKEKYPHIQCILVKPFSLEFFNTNSWTQKWEARLRAVIKEADFSTSLAKRYRKGIYFKRNEVIVDMSSEVIAYYDGGRGGTKHTIDYANRKGKTIKNIEDLER